MKLLRAELHNFKLLEDVSIEFSSNANQPLTVIRAENGSGKTSLLYGLLWGFYGMAGLPESARSIRLTSSNAEEGTPVTVSSIIEFSHTDDSGEKLDYRMIRSVVEIPRPGDKFDRQQERFRLLRLTRAGDEEVDAAEVLISKLIPLHLREVFFTNGDAVQSFISGTVSSQQRQSQVHSSINHLLGLDDLRTALSDIETVYRRHRKELAQAGGADTDKLERAIASADEDLEAQKQLAARLEAQLNNMTNQRSAWEKELNSLRGIGDLDELNERIERARRDRQLLEDTRGSLFGRMRDLLRSEECSWALAGEQLDWGINLLSELADRGIIPGASLEVLTDRLHLEQCICGESLAAGSKHRSVVEKLRQDQLGVSKQRQRLTELFHLSRLSKTSELGRVELHESFEDRRQTILKEFTATRDAMEMKGAEIKSLEERRALINEERVRDLADKLRGVEGKLATTHSELGRVNSRIEISSKDRDALSEELAKALKSARLNADMELKRDISDDLHRVAKGTLTILETDYVHKVSDRMNQLFLQIVGSHPDFEASIFSKVYIDDKFNIVVEAGGGRRLDTDFELNGASQRALTLSFIWALMEISGVTAPRIIDTPLGMVSGGVKVRMVDTITTPSTQDHDFQVVLLLTRSELRDVEPLIDSRAGIVRTLSASSHYPEDLVYSWGVDHPVSRVCSCTHRESCRICARRYDDRHGLTFKDIEASI